MNKFIALFLVFILSFTMIVGCSSPKESEDSPKETEEKEPEIKSRISIAGVYYGDCGAENGYTDLFVVFDYTNDAENRTMPTDISLVSVTLNGVNTYSANDNVEHKMYHNDYYYITDYGWFERYTGLRYVIGYGELLGGAAPARMFAHFCFNANDMVGAENITFTVDDQIAEFEVSRMTEISVIDEIVQVNGNYENDIIAASGLWRLDSVFRHVTFLADAFGADLDHMKAPMDKMFSSEVPGNVSVFEAPEYGLTGPQDNYQIGEYIDTLPSFNLDVFLAAYPNEADDISKIVTEYAELANLTLTSEQLIGLDRAEELINSIRQTYANVCSSIEIEVSPE